MNELTLVRRIRARPELVFDAISTPEGISQWWGPDAGPVLIAEMDLRLGGRFRVRFRMLDGTEHESSGEVLQLVRPKLLVMSWTWLGREAEGEASQLTLALRAIGEGTELTLTHSLLPSAEAATDHEHGWSGALDKLERLFSSEGARHG